MIFTLNGELLITDTGSELCFADFETEDGEAFILVCVSPKLCQVLFGFEEKLKCSATVYK